MDFDTYRTIVENRLRHHGKELTNQMEPILIMTFEKGRDPTKVADALAKQQ